MTASIIGYESGITVTPGAARTLTFTGPPASVTAGATNDVTVTARDAYGNVATGYTGTVSLTSSDPHAVLPLSYTFAVGDAGQHRFAVAFDTSGTQTITSTDTRAPSVTGTESGITVQAAAAKTLAVTGFPTTDAAGATETVTVTAYDPYGNVATGYTGTVAITSSDAQAQLPSNFSYRAADSGTHTFSITLETVGSQSITATDTASSSISGTESNIIVRGTPRVTVTQTGTKVVITQGQFFRKQKRTFVRPTSVQLTVEIAPSGSGGDVPTGEVTFELLKKTKKKVKVTTLETVALSGGKVTVALKSNRVLKKAITIVYSGDANDKPSFLTIPKLTRAPL